MHFILTKSTSGKVFCGDDKVQNNERFSVCTLQAQSDKSAKSKIRVCFGDF